LALRTEDLRMQSLLFVASLLAPAADRPIEVRYVFLWEEYGENQIAADKKYKSKVVELLITPEYVRKDDKSGRFYVGAPTVDRAILSPAEYRRLSPKQRKWYDEGYPANVLCYIPAANQDAFAKPLPKDELVRIRARVIGRKKADVFQGYVVELEDGKLLSK
jgi:hypothetical protein